MRCTKGKYQRYGSTRSSLSHSVKRRGKSQLQSRPAPSRAAWPRPPAPGVSKAGMVKSFWRVSGVSTKPGFTTLTPHPLRAQVQKQGFGQVDERRLGRAIGQALRQAAPARHTGHQTQMRRAPGLGRGQQARYHSGQQVQRSGQVHLLVAQQLGQGQRVGAHGAVVARAVAHQIQRRLRLQVIGGVLHCLGIGHVQHQRLAAGVLLHNASSSACWRAETITWAPWACNCTATARPMPLEAPTSHTTLCRASWG